MGEQPLLVGQKTFSLTEVSVFLMLLSCLHGRVACCPATAPQADSSYAPLSPTTSLLWVVPGS